MVRAQTQGGSANNVINHNLKTQKPLHRHGQSKSYLFMNEKILTFAAACSLLPPTIDLHSLVNQAVETKHDSDSQIHNSPPFLSRTVFGHDIGAETPFKRPERIMMLKNVL